MTKTTCPYCGAKCEAKVVHGVVLKTHMTAIPQHLTKLREVYERWVNYKLSNNGKIIGFDYDIYRVIKELLEENK